MARETKKVILFIVEGPTDETTFSSVMKKLHASQTVVFHVVHGDITSDRNVNSQNAVAAVNDQVLEEMKKYRLTRTDILRIIHLADTDGCFVPDEVIQYGGADKLTYGLDEILVPEGSQIATRNHNKASVMNRLCATSKIAGTPYRLYYLSRNLEHVLFDVIEDLTDEEKMDYADEFADRYDDDPEAFVAYMSNSEFTVPGSYRDTWRYVAEGTNSLHRLSNLHLALPIQDEQSEDVGAIHEKLDEAEADIEAGRVVDARISLERQKESING